jgi:hypothetical protein
MTPAKSQLDTRRAAHARVEPTKAETCNRIMDFAVARGTHGLTSDELVDIWQCEHNHVAPRVSELKQSGLLVETDFTRLTRHGCSARVLVAKQFKKPAEPERLAKAREWIANARTEPKPESGSLFGDLSRERYPD